jgi:anti-sigma B factor antagonist
MRPRDSYPLSDEHTCQQRSLRASQPMCDHHAVAGLDVEIQAHAGQAILVLRGDLDMATEAQLHDIAVAQLAVQGLTKLELDLAGITFLDSTGVTALLDLRQQANDRAIDMEILAVSPRAARILALVGLAETFGIPADPDTAPGQSADRDS